MLFQRTVRKEPGLASVAEAGRTWQSFPVGVLGLPSGALGRTEHWLDPSRKHWAQWEARLIHCEVRTCQPSKKIGGDICGKSSFQKKRKELRTLRGRKVEKQKHPPPKNLGFWGQASKPKML